MFCVDGNCIHMVDNGIVEKLMDLLDRHVEDGNVTVQHAALSALRNLAIPGKQLQLCGSGTSLAGVAGGEPAEWYSLESQPLRGREVVSGQSWVNSEFQNAVSKWGRARKSL